MANAHQILHSRRDLTVLTGAAEVRGVVGVKLGNDGHLEIRMVLADGSRFMREFKGERFPLRAAYAHPLDPFAISATDCRIAGFRLSDSFQELERHEWESEEEYRERARYRGPEPTTIVVLVRAETVGIDGVWP